MKKQIKLLSVMALAAIMLNGCGEELKKATSEIPKNEIREKLAPQELLEGEDKFQAALNYASEKLIIKDTFAKQNVNVPSSYQLDNEETLAYIKAVNALEGAQKEEVLNGLQIQSGAEDSETVAFVQDVLNTYWYVFRLYHGTIDSDLQKHDTHSVGDLSAGEINSMLADIVAKNSGDTLTRKLNLLGNLSAYAESYDAIGGQAYQDFFDNMEERVNIAYKNVIKQYQ